MKANTILTPGGASMIQKAGTSLVASTGTKQGQLVFLQGGAKAQSLLNKAVKPQNMVPGPRPAGAQSLLTTTIGNQTVILQLLAEQQAKNSSTVSILFMADFIGHCLMFVFYDKNVIVVPPCVYP